MNTKTILIGQYRVEVKIDHWSGIHENWWARVIGPQGVMASFGKVVPPVRPAELARASAERDAIAYVDAIRAAEQAAADQLHALVKETPVTGWDNGLSQDYNRALGRWFAERLGARRDLKRAHPDK